MAKCKIRSGSGKVVCRSDTRRVRDMCAGEVRYITPWSVDIDVCRDAVAYIEPMGTAKMGIKRINQDEYEIWME